jgi:hypothetical protein
MDNYRKYPRSGRRSILNASNLVSQVGEDVLICAPIGAFLIARKFLADRGTWRTNYALSYDDGGYYLPDDDTMATIEQMINEFLEATSDMNCTDLTSALDDISASLMTIAANSSCGCGSGGAGGNSPDVSTDDTGDITGTTGTPPDGYDTWEQYQQTKCDVANWIVQNMLDDIGWWKAFGVADLTVTAMVAGMASVLSGFTLTALLAAVAGLWAYSVSTLDQLETTLTNDYDDLVCSLVNGENAQESIDDFLAEMNGALSADISDSVALYFAELVASKFADPAQINLLYADYASVSSHQFPSGNDCGDCGIPCANEQMVYGNNLGAGLFESEYASSSHRIGFYLNNNGSAGFDPCSDMEDVTIDAVTGWTIDPASSPKDFRVWEDDSPLAIIYDSDTPFTGMTFCCRYIGINSSTAFTLQITREGKC